MLVIEMESTEGVQSSRARARRRIRTCMTVPMVPPNCEDYVRLWDAFFIGHERVGRQDCKLSVLLYDSTVNRRVDENTSGDVVYRYVLPEGTIFMKS